MSPLHCAAAALLAYIYRVACNQFRLSQFLDVQISALVLIQSVELCFHKAHELLFGNPAIFVGVHKEQQLFDLLLPDRQFISPRRN